MQSLSEPESFLWAPRGTGGVRVVQRGEALSQLLGAVWALPPGFASGETGPGGPARSLLWPPASGLGLSRLQTPHEQLS